MEFKLAYNIGLYRGHDIDKTLDGFVILDNKKVVYLTHSTLDDVAIRYRAMQIIDKIHSERRKEVDANIQRVDAQVRRYEN
jgi:hypothetical protein